MWTLTRQGLINQAAQILHIENKDGRRISYYAFLEGLQQPDFATFFNRSIVESPFPALSWECRPVRRIDLQEPFECVVLESPGLLGIPSGDPSAFQAYFEPDRLVVDFPNLGGDAHLIAPCPKGDASAFGHLAVFCREADPLQVIAFWSSVGKNTQARIGDQPLWLSTHGLGVFWLHVRLDSYPKYYSYRRYRNFSV